MDKQYSVQFFTSLVESIQKCCRDFLDFDQAIELSGYLNLEIDNFKKERYVLSEMISSTGDVISESYCTKAFKTVQRNPRRSPSCTDSILKDSSNHFDRNHSNIMGVRASPAPPDVSRTAVRRHFGLSQRHYVSPFHSGRRRNLIQNRKSMPTSFTQISPSQSKNTQPYEIQARAALGTFPSEEAVPSTSQSFSSYGNDSVTSSVVKTGISVEDSDHSKDKPSGDLEALYAAATSVSNLEQSEFTPVSSIYSSVSQTNVETTNTSTSSALETADSYAALSQQTDTINLPVTIKEEGDDDDDDVMFIESPNDISGNVSGQSVSIVNTDSRVDISHGSLPGHVNTADGQMYDGDGSAGADMKRLKMMGGFEQRIPVKLDPSNFKWLPQSNPNSVYQAVHTGLYGQAGSLSHDMHSSFNHSEYDMKGNEYQSNALKMYKCDLCGYEASRNYNLTRHMRTHTGNRMQCPLCDRTFIDNYKLKFHLKGHTNVMVDPSSESSHVEETVTQKMDSEVTKHEDPFRNIDHHSGPS